MKLAHDLFRSQEKTGEKTVCGTAYARVPIGKTRGATLLAMDAISLAGTVDDLYSPPPTMLLSCLCC